MTRTLSKSKLINIHKSSLKMNKTHKIKNLNANSFVIIVPVNSICNINSMHAVYFHTRCVQSCMSNIIRIFEHFKADRKINVLEEVVEVLHSVVFLFGDHQRFVGRPQQIRRHHVREARGGALLCSHVYLAYHKHAKIFSFKYINY